MPQRLLPPPRHAHAHAARWHAVPHALQLLQVRTGCGKSQVSRYIIDELDKLGKKCVLVRHPMVSAVSPALGRQLAVPLVPCTRWVGSTARAARGACGLAAAGGGAAAERVQAHEANTGRAACVDGLHPAPRRPAALPAAVRQPGGAGGAALCHLRRLGGAQGRWHGMHASSLRGPIASWGAAQIGMHTLVIHTQQPARPLHPHRCCRATQRPPVGRLPWPQVTIEEREEYEQHLKLDTIVYAGASSASAPSGACPLGC